MTSIDPWLVDAMNNVINTQEPIESLHKFISRMWGTDTNADV